jgi:hypothetical protein
VVPGTSPRAAIATILVVVIIIEKGNEMRTSIRKAVVALTLAVLATIAWAGTASAATSTSGSDTRGQVHYSLTSAARSVKTTFFNDSDCTFDLAGAWLYHGMWSIYPPTTIYPHATVVFGSESNGLFTGTAGEVQYTPQLGCLHHPPTFTLYWNDPYVGSNSYIWEFNSVNPDGWKLTMSGGSGNNASVYYHLF